MVGTITGAFVVSLLILVTRSFTGVRPFGLTTDDCLDLPGGPSGDYHSDTRTKDRPLILYAYSESEHARINLGFFVNQGLHDAADFIFIFNGETDMVSIVPPEPNIKVVERPNTCFDLGAFGEVLQEDNLWKKYKRFITLNASIRGPFVPFWSDQCWSDAYLGRLTNETKLVGMTASCGPPSFIHSSIWATDDVGMEILLHPPPKPREDGSSSGHPWTVGYSTCYATMWDAIDAEAGTTSMMEHAGYHVKALMSTWSATPGDMYWEECAYHPGDPSVPGAYQGTNIHPYETFFHKSNRGIDPAMLTLMTTLHSKGYNAGRSYQLCK
ncbi:uncharacterized protein B0I36DRAFT_376218 [Microdochium trichocladiopsis]|uniref:Uncharacterized protein n=1 Tax=Microdochium trichocladiopsis TaxID=1682393 RepID=A0A9P8Y0G7_9PEZI|nr:uncharacterized protein B0I36DRAFT_376218 [Microdochium trichocladiopsis]KAH7026463.1 hypothetical protein B0I36DRAFT_376218 [Microdochium trichocladiopsis]